MRLEQQNSMNIGYLLVSLASLTTAIRVDWNTNKGPIVPSIPTIRPVPQPPFRSPAPVWEDQSSDIPNPNPYQYVLPPPSRPKYPNNYLTLPLYSNRPPAFQILPIPPSAINSLYYDYKNNIVPGFGIQYIPSFGNRYTYVLPATASTTTTSTTVASTSAIKTADYIKPDKLNGKYNPKLKKYKAYEKYNNIKRQAYLSNNNSNSAFLQKQQLPYIQSPQPFKPIINPSVGKPASSVPATPNKLLSTKLYSIEENQQQHSGNNGNKMHNHNNPNTIVNLSKKS